MLTGGLQSLGVFRCLLLPAQSRWHITGHGRLQRLLLLLLLCRRRRWLSLQVSWRMQLLLHRQDDAPGALLLQHDAPAALVALAPVQ